MYIKQEDWDAKKKDIKSFGDVLLLFKIKEIEKQLSKEEAIKLINKGADVSSFGDPVEWQREVRKDRTIE